MIPVKTIEDVAVEIRHALLVQKALPRVGPKKLRAYWPAFPSESCENEDSFNYSPLPDEIDDMDLVFEKWLKVLPVEDKYLVLLRGQGRNWKDIQKKFKMSRSAVYNRYLRDLNDILKFAIREQNCKEKG